MVGQQDLRRPRVDGVLESSASCSEIHEIDRKQLARYQDRQAHAEIQTIELRIQFPESLRLLRSERQNRHVDTWLERQRQPSRYYPHTRRRRRFHFTRTRTCIPRWLGSC